MKCLIDADGSIISNDAWHPVQDKGDKGDTGDTGDKEAPTPPIQNYSLISLDAWQEIQQQQADIFTQHKNIGLHLSGNLTTSELLEKLGPADQAQQLLNNFSLLQIEITEFKDGRCFSLAMRLRNRLNYKGELRASGNYLPDQIYFMRRCGFNSFIIDTKMDEPTLLQTLKPFTEVYQRSGDNASPVTDKPSR